MKNVLKTADLSEYTDEQIKIMFQSVELFEMLKTIVEALKSGSIGRSIRYDPSNFDAVSPSKQILDAIKIVCDKNKIDSKLFNL